MSTVGINEAIIRRLYPKFNPKRLLTSEALQEPAWPADQGATRERRQGRKLQPVLYNKEDRFDFDTLIIVHVSVSVHGRRALHGRRRVGGGRTHRDARSGNTDTLDFKIPDTPTPHWQVVDTKSNVFLL